jgi:hypothetical protein
LGDEFALDQFAVYELLEGVEVGEFETGDGWVVGVFEEEGLAVAAILSFLLY